MTKLIITISFLLLLFTININIVLAAPKLGDFLRENGEYIYSSDPLKKFASEQYLRGLTHGLSVSNTFIHEKIGEKQQIFCPPTQVAFNNENYLDILKKIYSKDTELGNYDIGLIFVYFLKDYMPCN